MKTVTVTVVVAVVAVELFLRLPFESASASLLRSLHAATAVLRSSRISDHWKEKAMLGYANRTALASLQLTLLLAGLAAACAVLILVADRLAESESSTFAYLASPVGAAVASASAIAYSFIRNRLAR